MLKIGPYATIGMYKDSLVLKNELNESVSGILRDDPEMWVERLSSLMYLGIRYCRNCGGLFKSEIIDNPNNSAIGCLRCRTWAVRYKEKYYSSGISKFVDNHFQPSISIVKVKVHREKEFWGVTINDFSKLFPLGLTQIQEGMNDEFFGLVKWVLYNLGIYVGSASNRIPNTGICVEGNDFWMLFSNDLHPSIFPSSRWLRCDDTPYQIDNQQSLENGKIFLQAIESIRDQELHTEPNLRRHALSLGLIKPEMSAVFKKKRDQALSKLGVENLETFLRGKYYKKVRR